MFPVWPFSLDVRSLLSPFGHLFCTFEEHFEIKTLPWPPSGTPLGTFCPAWGTGCGF